MRALMRAVYIRLPRRWQRAAWLWQDEVRTAWLGARLRPPLRAVVEKYKTAPHIFVYPPNLTWENLRQRPHQLLRALARAGQLCFFCSRNPAADGVADFREIEPRLYVTAAPVGLFAELEPVLLASRPTNLGYCARLPQHTLVYDYLDELTVYEDYGPEMERDHAELVRRARVVLVTAGRLREQILAVRPEALLSPNAADYAAFAPTRQWSEPEALRALPHPLIGYYGALAAWFDYSLVRTIAAARPAWHWVLIGPNYDDSLLNSGVWQLPNVHWLGSKPYSDLPAYLHQFDVATIPFQLTPLTHATSPVKLFEYMSAQKPIVTTALHECEQYPVVQIAHTALEFITEIERALTLRDDSAHCTALDSVARLNTWDVRAADLLARLQ